MEKQNEEILALLESAQVLLEQGRDSIKKGKLPMQIEIRTLEFWRAIIGECIATFFYVMLISSTHQALNFPNDSIATVQFFSAITAGLAMLTLTHAFYKISGSHFNPAISVAAALLKRITVLRAALYICAQCGGAIAGAALIYGVYGKNGAKDQFRDTSIANFGMEFILTFLVAFVYFGVTSKKRSDSWTSSVSIGMAYMTSLVAYRGSLNPARALGPAFVADAFAFHWVYWVGPILGAACGGFCYTFIFNIHKTKWKKKKDVDNISMKSDDDMLDDLERVRQFKASMMTNYNDGLAGVPSVYNTAVKPYKQAVQESMYSGTKSLYNAPMTDGRRTPGFDCSKSMYGGIDEVKSRVQLKRSLSVHSKMQRRNPQDNLPDEPAALRAAHTRQQSHLAEGQLRQTAEGQLRQAAEGQMRVGDGPVFASDAMYREYIRQKNIAADQHSPVDQCSGSSSGYYSSSREQEELRREQEELRREQEELRREQELKQEYFHRRERSVGSTRGEYRREELRQEREGRSAPPLADDMRGGRSQNYTPSTTSSFHSNGY